MWSRVSRKIPKSAKIKFNKSKTLIIILLFLYTHILAYKKFIYFKYIECCINLNLELNI